MRAAQDGVAVSDLDHLQIVDDLGGEVLDFCRRADVRTQALLDFLPELDEVLDHADFADVLGDLGDEAGRRDLTDQPAPSIVVDELSPP